MLDALWHRSDIVGFYFDKLVWLTDRSTSSDAVDKLALNALFFLSGEQPSSATLESWRTAPVLCLRKRLEDSPKTLIILDEVLQQEVVEVFSDLPVSVFICLSAFSVL